MLCDCVEKVMNKRCETYSTVFAIRLRKKKMAGKFQVLWAFRIGEGGISITSYTVYCMAIARQKKSIHCAELLQFSKRCFLVY